MKDHFDGSYKQLQERGIEWVLKEEILHSYRNGSSLFRYAKTAIMKYVFTFSLFFFMISLVIAGIAVYGAGIIGLLAIPYMFVFYFIPILILGLLFLPLVMVLNLSIPSNNRVELTEHSMLMRYKENIITPHIITILPYWMIKDIRPISNSEWRFDHGMRNPIRWILNRPKWREHRRFPLGTPKRNIFVIELDRRIWVHSFFSFFRPNRRIWLEILLRPNEESRSKSYKLFFSMKKKEFSELKENVDDLRKGVKRNLPNMNVPLKHRTTSGKWK